MLVNLENELQGLAVLGHERTGVEGRYLAQRMLAHTFYDWRRPLLSGAVERSPLAEVK